MQYVTTLAIIFTLYILMKTTKEVVKCRIAYEKINKGMEELTQATIELKIQNDLIVKEEWFGTAMCFNSKGEIVNMADEQNARVERNGSACIKDTGEK